MQTERQYNRVATKQTLEGKKYLQNYVEAFLNESIGKDEKEIKAIRERYEDLWIAFVKVQNARNKIRAYQNQVITLYEDAFERSCNSGRRSVGRMQKGTWIEQDLFDAQIKEYKRIFRIVEHKTLISKLSFWIGKHFFVASTKYKLDGTPKTQLRVVK